MKLHRIVLPIILTTVVATTVAEQTPPPFGTAPQLPGATATPPASAGTAIVRGRVTASGEPLHGVQLRLMAPVPRIPGQRALPTTTTGTTGEYELPGLPAGRYTVVAGKAGYYPLQYLAGRSSDANRTIEVADGEILDGIDFEFARAGVLSGHVIDGDGDPVTGALVQVLREMWVRGWPRLVSGVADMDRTDDLGEFRLHGIPPGTYVLAASVIRPSSSPAASLMLSLGVGSAATFYPRGVSPAEAQPIAVGAGEEIGGLTVTLAPPALATVTGVVRNEAGETVSSNVSIGQDMPFSPGGLSSFGLPTDEDGTFKVPELPPGRYEVRARNSDIEGAVARTKIDLRGADVFVPLTFRSGNVARGRLVLRSDAPPENLTTSVQARTAEVDPDSAGSIVRDDLTFEITGLSGQRLITVNPPAGWALENVRVGGTDVTDMPLDFDAGDVSGIEVVLTDRLTEVSGVVSDANGDPVRAATVVLFADDPARWIPESRYIVTARPDQTGRFRHSGLPAGNYLAVALAELEPGQETNPATLERLRSAGTGFTLEDGVEAVVDLPLTGGL